MNIKTLFKKRVYEYLNYRYLALYRNVQKNSSKEYVSIDEFINSIPKESFEEIVVVASGPSSKLLKTNKKALYLCTNNSVNMVNDQSFLYLIQDYFYALRYIKKHFNHKDWLGTLCIVNENGFEGNRKVHRAVKKLLTRFKRSKAEILVSDIYNESPFTQNFQGFDNFLEKTFDYRFVSLNSGFSMLLFSTYLAHRLSLPVRVYGLDFGLGGYEYFDGTKIEAHCSYSDVNKNTMSVFYKKLYDHPDFEISNYSYFQSNVNN